MVPNSLTSWFSICHGHQEPLINVQSKFAVVTFDTVPVLLAGYEQCVSLLFSRLGQRFEMEPQLQSQ